MTDVQLAVPNPTDAPPRDDGTKTTSAASHNDDAAETISTTDGSSRSDEGEDDRDGHPPAPGPRRISLSVRTLAIVSAFVVLLAAAGALAWLYVGERDTVLAQQRRADDDKRAERIALDYAVNAATMNFRDLKSWKAKLANGTTTTLTDKLTKAATSMEQLLVPLEWNSTAQPLVAKVRADTGGIFVVDTFVSVLTKTVQAPENLQSTATYSITVDGKDGWQISDVGGIGAVIAAK